MLDQQLTNTWKDYASVKTWKKDLKINSRSNKLSKSTEEAINSYMPLFIEFKQKTPDEIIEEALAGKHVVKESLSDFQTWLEDVKGKKYNHSVQISYYIIRGFYSHNDIPTQKIRTPSIEPSKVQLDDNRLPLFEIKEFEENGKKVKKKIIRRDLLKSFYEFLSPRDKIIAMCLKDSGLDSGDLLKLPLSLSRYQDPNEQRIFVSITRNKTKQLSLTFISTETTKLLKNYEKMYRNNALDDEPIFVQSSRDFKAEFKMKHGREFNSDMDEMILKPVNTHMISMNFRIATEKLEKQMGIKLLFDNKQSPLRPKRFRKLFTDICSDCGIDPNIKNLFRGKSDNTNKVYEGQSRQDLELIYEKIEPSLLIYTEPSEDNNTEEIKYLKKDLESMRKELHDTKNNQTQNNNNESFMMSKILENAKNLKKSDYEKIIELLLKSKE